ncbi:NAD(P)-binding protein [Viridothelium virens]|uniref:NAD(P)-binding protein n=1 Tax=Viridothelium virens TaxID=1048519 RepID=A0A6A6GZ97_VIRVR|nr:NAD(P)-binding protein [Viridothelium virens]
MPNILITGAASGLGAEFMRLYCADSKNRVFACDKDPVLDIAENVVKSQGDITSLQYLSSLEELLKNIPIDLVIHSVGIRGLVPTVEAVHPTDVARAESLEVMNEDIIARTFQINTIGTFSLIKCLLPNLHQAYIANGRVCPKVIVMSSRMGSIGHNTSGGAYAYRMSKAALNAMIRSFSFDISYATFLMVHPGRVETGLTKSREEGAIEAEESVASMLKLINFADKPHSGKFVDRFGVEIPW